MLAGYDHLLAAAARLQWDAETIDLSADVRRVADLPAAQRSTLRTLVTGFRLAEHAVADALAPYAQAATELDADPAAAKCFAAQAADEARHAWFFDRLAGEVLGLDEQAPDRHAPPAIRRLFASDLPDAARALVADVTTMPAAVGLYHLVLEGIVFAVGQEALIELAQGCGLPGIAEGVARVQGDERWHVGLGVLALQRLGEPVEVTAAARRAIAGWGPEIATPARTEPVLTAHRRRLQIAAPAVLDRAGGSPTQTPGCESIRGRSRHV